MWHKRTSNLSTLLTVLLAGCGGSSDGDRDPPIDMQQQQSTSCGTVSCQIGQYCYDERFAQCENGCLADTNCASNQFCDKTKQPDPLDANVGSCENRQNPNPMPMPSNQLARCKAACTILVQCSAITAGDGAECDNGCTTATEAQQKAVGDCIGNWDCSGNIPGCANLQCGPNYPCGGGQSCVGGRCL